MQQAIAQQNQLSVQQQMAQQQMAQQQMAQQQMTTQQQQMATQQQQQMATQQQQMATQQQMVQQAIAHQQMPQQQVVQQQVGQQQMMVCPIRFVYETPILVQQGDQMQQNQAIFINPQNPPPWARPVQNQVIYLQHLTPNMMPIQQQIDPNMYMQPNLAYQQLLQASMLNNQQMIHQNQQIPMQVVAPNMIQNVQTLQANVATNTQGVSNDIRQFVSNYTASQPNTVQNVVGLQNAAQSQTNVDNRQAVANAQAQMQANQAAANQRALEIQRQAIYRNVLPQTTQPSIVSRPQMPVIMNQVQNLPSQLQNIANFQRIQGMQNAQNMQNVQTTVNVPNLQTLSSSTNVQKIANVQNVQNFQQIVTSVAPNVQQPMPMQIQNVATNSHSNALQNVAVTNTMVQNLQPGLQKGTEVSNNRTSNTVTYSAVRNGQPYTYRAIQPKPPPYRPNYVPRNPTPVYQRPNMHTKQNITYAASPVPGTKISNYTEVNRKRKSESPDELHKKIVANTSVYGSITVTPKLQENQGIATVSQERGMNTSPVPNKVKFKINTSEAGANTNPVHKVEEKQNLMLQINPMEVDPSNIKEEPRNVTQNIQQPIKTEKHVTEHIKNERVEVKSESQQTDKEKFYRNTVYTQARCRSLSDKQNNAHNTMVPGDIVKTESTHTNVDVKHTIPIQENFRMLVETAVQSDPVSLPSVQKTDNSNQTVARVKDMPQLDEETKPTDTALSLLNATIKKNLEIKEEISKLKLAEIKSESITMPEPPPLLPDKITVPKTHDNFIKPEEKLPKQAELSPKTTTVPDVSKSKIKTEDVKSTLSKLKHETKLLNPEKPPKITDKTNKSDETPVNEVKRDFKTENERDRKEYKNLSTSVNDMRGRELHIVDGNVLKLKEERDYVLTHVLDGYVIQESNVPFAIRKPLRENTININKDQKQENLNLLKESMKEKESLSKDKGSLSKDKDSVTKDKDSLAKDKGKILDIAQLNISEDKTKDVEKNDTEKVVNEENPFGSLKPSAVKSWTVSELGTHLSRYNWTDTISIFQEHEIDGESLFLVSKPQLVHIGINETHADVICEFVKS